MASEAEQIKKFEEFNREFAKLDRVGEPHHFIPQSGDRILIDRTRFRLVNNRELSTEATEVIDVVEK